MMKVRSGAAGAGFALLAAALYALNMPLSKLLLGAVGPTMLAALLYLGAGLGLLAVGLCKRALHRGEAEAPLGRRDLPYTLGMIALDIAAPILLMLGLSSTTAESASLLNNFEIVATTLMAMLLFRERVSWRLWIAIVLICLSSILLCVEDVAGFVFSKGSLLVLGACLCWGLENNCTRRLSAKSPTEIVVLKGLFSGLGSLLIAFGIGERLPAFLLCLTALGLGFVAYGLSIYFYIRAQRELGAARTSAYYASAPFIGVALSLLLLREWPGAGFLPGLIVMAAGTFFVVRDQLTAQA